MDLENENTENEKANYISRLVEFDDWQITHDLKSYGARIQSDVSLIIIQQSSLDSFRVSGIWVRQESTSLPKS